MRICIINHSDSRGGASVVSRRLMHTFRSLGHDAYMLVVHKGTDDPYVYQAASALRCKIPFLEEHLRLFYTCGFSKKNIFKISCASDGLSLSRHPLVKSADAIILNWVNQGMLSMDEIGRIARAKPTIWTMHDMWNLTSLCHHAGKCRQFTSKPSCCACPLISLSAFGTRVWTHKNALYQSTSITFVAVSNWLKDKSKMSTLLGNFDIPVIPNPFPVEEFYTEPKEGRAELGLPEDKKLIVMGAARLDDPVKGFDFLPEIFRNLIREDFTLVLFGNMKNRSVLDQLIEQKIPVVWLGSLSQEKVKELFAHSDVVISTSRYETLPGTIIEGMAAGCTPVTFDSGGQKDIITNNSLGYLVEPYDNISFATAISRALDSPVSRGFLNLHINNIFSAECIAKKYLALL